MAHNRLFCWLFVKQINRRRLQSCSGAGAGTAGSYAANKSMALDYLQEQDIAKSYRLLNIGATTLIGASLNGDIDYMAAAWAGVCDYDKGYAVIDKTHYTRPLIEKSGKFVLCYPSAALAEQVMKLGSISKNDDADKLDHCNIELIEIPGFSMPVIKGCVAYLEYEVIPEPHFSSTYDIFLGKCLKVVTDSRVYSNNHWHFDQADDSLRTLHYVAGGHFFTIGKELFLKEYGD